MDDVDGAAGTFQQGAARRGELGDGHEPLAQRRGTGVAAQPGDVAVEHGEPLLGAQLGIEHQVDGAPYVLALAVQPQRLLLAQGAVAEHVVGHHEAAQDDGGEQYHDDRGDRA